MRRVIKIIGYDPSTYFKGEMSFMNMEQLRRGNVPENATKPADGSLKKAKEVKPPLAKKMDKVESLYRHDNLNSNLNQVVQKYDMASRQLKDLVDILRKVNGTREVPKALAEEKSVENPYLQESRT